MEYYIYNVPVFLMGEESPYVNTPEFCTAAEETVPQELLINVDVVYIGDMRELNGRNATYYEGAIYMTNTEPTCEDMLENFVHEVAHSLESVFGTDIYTQDLIDEFKGKRKKLFHILQSHGFDPSPVHATYTEYSAQWDKYLSDVVGYPTLLNLTMGLFASPYAATSIQEYFANGFEKYYLEEPWSLKKVSPILFDKIESVVNV
tara:strand:+ start:25233 stop:25844 length:612 start_codon:yes stop_codon:yes gene_type:complete